jgi:hypothetical protein
MTLTNKKKIPSINTIKNGIDIFNQALNCINAQHNGNSVIIPHVCNNINSYAAGFAAQVADRFPVAKENFHLLGKTAKLGQVQHILVAQNKNYGHRLYISNMIAQNGIKSQSNSRPINYAALCYCMNDVKNFVQKLQKEEEIPKVQIHSPKFGSGLAGGNWDFISDLIEDIWSNIEVYVYLPSLIHKK